MKMKRKNLSCTYLYKFSGLVHFPIDYQIIKKNLFVFSFTFSFSVILYSDFRDKELEKGFHLVTSLRNDFPFFILNKRNLV